MQAPSSGAHASSATLWPKLEPIQVALQFGTNATGILLAGEITQVKEAIPWVRCASGNVLTISSVQKYFGKRNYPPCYLALAL